jgi:hypothetical protein
VADDVVEQIKREAKLRGVNITELNSVRGAFRGYFEDESSKRRQITLEVSDSGSGWHRYNLTARGEGDRLATGNGAADLDDAISLVHWGNLLKA